MLTLWNTLYGRLLCRGCTEEHYDRYKQVLYTLAEFLGGSEPMAEGSAWQTFTFSTPGFREQYRTHVISFFYFFSPTALFTVNDFEVMMLFIRANK